MDRQVIGIAGMGLIGGSFARDLLAKGHGVVGHDLDENACSAAMELGVVHHASTDISALDDCSAILIAVPVLETRSVMRKLAKLDTPNLVAIFDAGSTKAQVADWAKQDLEDHAGKFVPCHPIAGTEHSGVQNAKNELFAQKRVILCDPPDNAQAVKLVTDLWQECDAVTETLSCADHDRQFAAVSHLPHMLAYLLVGMLGSRPNRDQLLSFAASGFADFTRIASSDEQMWRDVCLTNKERIIEEIDHYHNELSKLRDMIDDSDGKSLHEYFSEARKLRNNWLESKK